MTFYSDANCIRAVCRHIRDTHKSWSYSLATLHQWNIARRALLKLQEPSPEMSVDLFDAVYELSEVLGVKVVLMRDASRGIQRVADGVENYLVAHIAEIVQIGVELLEWEDETRPHRP